MPKFTKGPYRAGPVAGGRAGYTAISSHAGNWHEFAEFVTDGGDDGGTRMQREGQANVRLFLQAPAMFDMLVWLVREHGKRGGVYDHLLPAAEQQTDIARAMTIIAEIEGEML